MGQSEDDKTNIQPLTPADEGEKTQVYEKQRDATLLMEEGTGPAATWQSPVEVNSVLLSRFKLVQLIGEGGMSEVYKAIDLRKVEAGARNPYLAVKVLTVRFDDYFSSLSVMHHEAQKLQTLTHPNIVRVIDWDRDGQTVFMTMEHLDGKPLKLSMPRGTLSPTLPREEALRVIGGIAAALEFAHAKDIIHGDLKPGNVIITKDNEVKVIDFGIAQFLQRPNEEVRDKEAWRGSFSALTPPYASPEMHDDAAPDPRDDIYALGCMAYELLVGEHPFGRVAANQARDSKLTVPPSSRLRSHEYRALVRALKFDRESRTPSVREFIEEINGVRARTNRQLLTMGIVGVLAVVGMLFLARSWMKAAPVPPPVAAPSLASTGPQGPGSMFRDCPTCPLMTVLPSGEFEQGTAEGAGTLSFEKPAHLVGIVYPLAAGVNEVTAGEFAEFDKEYPRERQGCATFDGEWAQRNGENWKSVARQNPAYPVTCVSWQDAVDYAAWLSLRTGSTYRLPSASEWEYLARAGQPGTPWRKNAAGACANANVADRAATQTFPGFQTFDCMDGFAQAAPVGSFLPNAFGLADTLGNVFEWTQDCWRDDYSNAPTDGSAVLEGNCAEREARGGSWFTNPDFVRPEYRNRFDAGYRSSSLGFRLIREINP